MGELRKDPVLGRWVIIATERSKRPDAFLSVAEAQGDDEKKCPFCAGREKETPPEIYSLRDPKTKPDTSGWRVRVVPNKFSACNLDVILEKKGYGVHDMMTNFGVHEVIIETPDHKKEIKDQTPDEASEVITVLQRRVEELHKNDKIHHALLFKNKGKGAGATIAHPHHQLIALPITPKRVREELEGAKFYFKLKERCVFCDIIEQEKSWGERMLYENEGFVSFCPYASRFPFEVWLLPKEHSIDFYGQKAKEKTRLLAEALQVILKKYDKVLKDPAYNYIIHTAPNRFPRQDYWKTIEQDFHWHIELFPWLTRVAGFEWGSGFYINPVSPEMAAKYLREAKV